MSKKTKKAMEDDLWKTLRPTSGKGGQAAAYLEWAFDELKQRIEGRKRQKKNGKTTIELDEIEFSNLLDGLERARESGILINKYEKEADEASFQILKIRNALEAIPNKGVQLADYKEMILRLGGKLPKRGKRIFYDPEKVLSYHSECIENIKKNEGVEKPETKHKEQAVRLVQERFGHPTFEATHRYLTRQKAKNLPFKQ